MVDRAETVDRDRARRLLEQSRNPGDQGLENAWYVFDALRREQGELLPETGLGSVTRARLKVQHATGRAPEPLAPKAVRKKVEDARGASRTAHALMRSIPRRPMSADAMQYQSLRAPMRLSRRAKHATSSHAAARRAVSRAGAVLAWEEPGAPAADVDGPGSPVARAASSPAAPVPKAAGRSGSGGRGGGGRGAAGPDAGISAAASGGGDGGAAGPGAAARRASMHATLDERVAAQVRERAAESLRPGPRARAGSAPAVTGVAAAASAAAHEAMLRASSVAAGTTGADAEAAGGRSALTAALFAEAEARLASWDVIIGGSSLRATERDASAAASVRASGRAADVAGARKERVARALRSDAVRRSDVTAAGGVEFVRGRTSADAAPLVSAEQPVRRYTSNYHGALVNVLDVPGARDPFARECRVCHTGWCYECRAWARRAPPRARRPAPVWEPEEEEEEEEEEVCPWCLSQQTHELWLASAASVVLTDMPDVVEHTPATLQTLHEHFRGLLALYERFATAVLSMAHASFAYTVDAREWQVLVAECKLSSLFFKKTRANIVFATVQRQQNLQRDVKKKHSRELDLSEFMEALVRLSFDYFNPRFREYGQKAHTTVPEALAQALREHILPEGVESIPVHREPQPSVRDAPAVARSLAEARRTLRAAFLACRRSAEDAGQAHALRTMSLKEWADMLRRAGVARMAGVSMRAVTQAFVMAQQEEWLKVRVIVETDDIAQLDWAEFQEAIALLAFLSSKPGDAEPAGGGSFGGGSFGGKAEREASPQPTQVTRVTSHRRGSNPRVENTLAIKAAIADGGESIARRVRAISTQLQSHPDVADMIKRLNTRAQRPVKMAHLRRESDEFYASVSTSAD